MGGQGAGGLLRLAPGTLAGTFRRLSGRASTVCTRTDRSPFLTEMEAFLAVPQVGVYAGPRGELTLDLPGSAPPD